MNAKNPNPLTLPTASYTSHKNIKSISLDSYSVIIERLLSRPAELLTVSCKTRQIAHPGVSSIGSDFTTSLSQQITSRH